MHPNEPQDRNRRASWLGQPNNNPLRYRQRETAWGFDTSSLENPGGPVFVAAAAAAATAATAGSNFVRGQGLPVAGRGRKGRLGGASAAASSATSSGGNVVAAGRSSGADASDSGVGGGVGTDSTPGVDASVPNDGGDVGDNSGETETRGSETGEKADGPALWLRAGNGPKKGLRKDHGMPWRRRGKVGGDARETGVLWCDYGVVWLQY